MISGNCSQMMFLCNCPIHRKYTQCMYMYIKSFDNQFQVGQFLHLKLTNT